MTFLELLVFIKKYLLFLTSLALFFAVAGFAVSVFVPPTFESTQALFVKRQTSSESKQFYNYDGYYSAQAAERFADSVFGALKSQEVLRYAVARVSSQADLDKEVRGIKVKRLSPQLISFSYRNQDRRTAEKLIDDLAASVGVMAAELNRGGDESLSLSLVSPKPLVKVITINPFLVTLMGFLLGGFLALILSASHYFYKNLPKHKLW